MDVYEYIDHAKANGIPLTWTHVSLYMRLYAAQANKDRFGYQFEIRENLDARTVLKLFNEYLDNREPACNES